MRGRWYPLINFPLFTNVIFVFACILLGAGYTDDPTIENKDSNTPTFVAIRCFVNTRK